MVEDRYDRILFELFDGYEHGGGVDEHLCPAGVNGHQVGSLEGLPQIGCHRNAAFYSIGLMYIRPLIVGEVGHRKRERVSSDANDHLSLIHYRALVMLATQRANSPAAMMASMILMSLLLICISGCKGTNKCEKNQMLFEI